MKQKILETLACGMPVFFSFAMIAWWMVIGYI